MPKISSNFVCQQCGYISSSFLGRCPECGSWGSLVEQVSIDIKGNEQRRSTNLPEVIDLSKLEKKSYPRISTGFSEFDLCLGGGIVPGSLVLVSGDPGIGKSTLLTQLALNISVIASAAKQSNKIAASAMPPRNDSEALYVAGEESAQQIKTRVDRIKPQASLNVLNETDVDLIIQVVEREKPSLVIVDSIQTLNTQDLSGISGSVGQVRESAHRLQSLAKRTHIPIFIVGHITKDGSIAGPKTLEHMVDVVLSLEGDPSSNFRILRTSKNRFGPTDEVGIFEMEEKGMVAVKNPSKIFLEQKVEAPGSAVVPILAGFRPLLVEIQALVTKSFLPVPRRTGSGIDNNRLQLLVAVLTKRLGLPLFDQDIFVNVTGGIKVLEPAADLGICLAIISSFKDKTIKPQTALIGEVGLLGEIRAVREVKKREEEAKKLGFTNVISPQNARSLKETLNQLST